jgi:hypothetical protein
VQNNIKKYKFCCSWYWCWRSWYRTPAVIFLMCVALSWPTVPLYDINRLFSFTSRCLYRFYILADSPCACIYAAFSSFSQYTTHIYSPSFQTWCRTSCLILVKFCHHCNLGGRHSNSRKLDQLRNLSRLCSICWGLTCLILRTFSSSWLATASTWFLNKFLR